MEERGLSFLERRLHGKRQSMPGIRGMPLVIALLSILSGCATKGPPQSPAVAGAEEAVRSHDCLLPKRSWTGISMRLSVTSRPRRFSSVTARFDMAGQKWRRRESRYSAREGAVLMGAASCRSAGVGKFALSTGPATVNDRIVGRFNLIWRLEAPHTWRIVFDKGEPVCADAAK